MLMKLLSQNEGKTLEFKENTKPLKQIVRTVVAFANTAGGTILIGVKDRTREIVGVDAALDEEERLASAFADSISPQLMPDIHIQSWRDRELLTITVPHAIGPYYVRSEGQEKGVYVRLGSTNRCAGPEMIDELKRFSRNRTYDEQPVLEKSSEAIDFRAASELFHVSGKNITNHRLESIGVYVVQGGRVHPSEGGMILFGKDRQKILPDALMRCARFKGVDRAEFVDQQDISDYLPQSAEKAISFVARNTRMALQIGKLKNKKKPEYSPVVVREAIINALVHADYSLHLPIQVAIFDDRIEVTNSGSLPFGLTLESALAGTSRPRNRVIARVFHELGLIEQWGSGMGRMIRECQNNGIQEPYWEELGDNFRVTLFNTKKETSLNSWQVAMLDALKETAGIGTKEASKLWNISDRAARTRLQKMVSAGLLVEIGSGPNDPNRVYVSADRSAEFRKR